MNVVIVSNRVARTNAHDPINGGLAAALLPAIREYGAVWVGSSGRLSERSDKEPLAEVQALGNGALATVNLPKEHYSGYYEGFSNSALWPMLHSRADLIKATREDFACYRHVNSFMARAALRFRRPNSAFWIHDYHFLLIGAELRQLGVEQPIGFFLHTPWPTNATVAALPHHREIVRAMLAYDLVGFQTEEDLENFIAYLTRDLGLSVNNGVVSSEHGRCQLAAFPIGIDADEFATAAIKSEAFPEAVRLRSSMQSKKLVIGVDRIDYSKGILTRMRGFERLLSTEPSFKRNVSLLQIAVPSRENIDTYIGLQSELATMVGTVNGAHADLDWTPIRYLNKAFPQSVLAGLYRSAQVGLVTPFHDGMNLVAKEYVAGQNPCDPGVLVLSRFAGAAKELDAALLVNPHDVDDIANRLADALRMTRDERCERWASLMKKLRANSIHLWFSSFLARLNAPQAGVPTLPYLPRTRDLATDRL